MNTVSAIEGRVSRVNGGVVKGKDLTGGRGVRQLCVADSDDGSIQRMVRYV